MEVLGPHKRGEVKEVKNMVDAMHRAARLWEIPEDVIHTGSDEAAIQAVIDRVADPEAFSRMLDWGVRSPRVRRS